MNTKFEIGKTYIFTDAFWQVGMDVRCKVVAKDEIRKTITIVEEYETAEVEIPYKRMIDPLHGTFEIAEYLGSNVFSSNYAKVTTCRRAIPC